MKRPAVDTMSACRQVSTGVAESQN